MGGLGVGLGLGVGHAKASSLSAWVAHTFLRCLSLGRSMVCCAALRPEVLKDVAWGLERPVATSGLSTG